MGNGKTESHFFVIFRTFLLFICLFTLFFLFFLLVVSSLTALEDVRTDKKAAEPSQANY